MTKEQIEKAVNDYIGYEPEVDEGLGTKLRREAFKDGAEWRINSVWHEASEAPEKNKYIAVMFKSKSKGFTLWYSTDDIIQVFKAHRITMWAYVIDLMPGIKEETE